MLLAGVAMLLAPSAVVAGPERRVLVVTEAAGFRHDSIEAAKALLRRLAKRSPQYRVRFLSTARELTRQRLRRAHAVAFVNTTGELPLTGEQQQALLDFVRSGKGFVGTHSASDTLHQWPAYARLLGGEFEAHPFVGEGRVVVEDRRHPATRHLPVSFLIREEFYVFRQDPRCCSHVLAALDTTSFGVPAADAPLVWCRREGRGRVFYDALGHFIETWHDARQRKLLAGGIAWALGLRRHPACG